MVKKIDLARRAIFGLGDLFSPTPKAQLPVPYTPPSTPLATLPDNPEMLPDTGNADTSSNRVLDLISRIMNKPIDRRDFLKRAASTAIPMPKGVLTGLPSPAPYRMDEMQSTWEHDSAVLKVMDLFKPETGLMGDTGDFHETGYVLGPAMLNLLRKKFSKKELSGFMDMVQRRMSEGGVSPGTNLRREIAVESDAQNLKNMRQQSAEEFFGDPPGRSAEIREGLRQDRNPVMRFIEDELGMNWEPGDEGKGFSKETAEHLRDVLKNQPDATFMGSDQKEIRSNLEGILRDEGHLPEDW